ncbi:hypothetical protein KEJ49_00035 [Candidatus Bathyarchaeota archaeon]|nr:hypothetical protein [Candidatus Bathyarchaeota archaeon]
MKRDCFPAPFDRSNGWVLQKIFLCGGGQNIKTRGDTPNPLKIDSRRWGCPARFHDEVTGHFIAIKEAPYMGIRRLIMVAYDIKNDVVEIVTAHPIGRGQVEARVKSGRWVHVS